MAILGSTDRQWEQFGLEEPYFGVVTHEQFRSENLDDESLEEFFETGEAYVASMLETVREHVDPGFEPRTALDFGCGVGRLAIPLSSRVESVAAVDVSTSMLRECGKNCAARSIDNVSLLESDDDLSAIRGEFDLIHSFIVFQHIPVRRGQRVFERLLDHLAEGGVGVMHFTYAKSFSTSRARLFAERAVSAIRRTWRLVRTLSFLAPRMQMNCYSVNLLLAALQARGIADVHCELTNHGGCLGLVLYFKRPSR